MTMRIIQNVQKAIFKKGSTKAISTSILSIISILAEVIKAY